MILTETAILIWPRLTFSSASNSVSMLLGNGTGGFGAATNYAVGTRPDSVAVGDFNSDSNPDLAVANYASSNVSVLLNTCSPATTATPTPKIIPTNTPEITSTPVAPESGHLTWQGISQPNAHNTGLTATLTLCNAGVPTSFTVTTDQNGNFTVNTNLPNGTYPWWIKGPRSLANSGTLTISGGSATVEFGTQRAGDANNTNVDNAQDFAILKAAFGTGSDLRADFNNDGVVNAQDFTLLKSNFGIAGATANCP